jgi:hypothetical protein
MCVLITFARLMLLRDFGPYGIISMAMCGHYFRFSRHY